MPTHKDLPHRIAVLVFLVLRVPAVASKLYGFGSAVLIGDSKHPDGPVLTYSRAEWKTFVEGIRGGDFDDLL